MKNISSFFHRSCCCKSSNGSRRSARGIDGEYLGPSPHAHRKGQPILSLHGAVSCEVEGALWLVPPRHAVWIPGDTPHSCRVTQNARTCFLFIEPGAAVMPAACCTLAITPLLRELILYLAGQEPLYPAQGKMARLAAVLLEQIPNAARRRCIDHEVLMYEGDRLRIA